MTAQASDIAACLDECTHHLDTELLPFWLDRCRDDENGGFITHFDRMINHAVGEWWPLMTREGEPIWTHMSHAWKVNYHTVRCMIECIRRLERLLSAAA